MDASSSLYQCLYLTSSASQEQIHEAYEQAVLFWAEQPNGSEYLKSLHFAYNILSDPMTRVAYDTYGLSNILEDESSYRERTPLPTPQSTPRSTPLATHTQATNIPTTKQPVPRVTFQLPEEQEKKKERREKSRMFEPEEDRRRKRDSSSRSKMKDKAADGRGGSTASKDKGHKSSSKGHQEKKKSSSKSTSRGQERTSRKDERSKEARRSGGSKERAHRRLECASL